MLTTTEYQFPGLAGLWVKTLVLVLSNVFAFAMPLRNLFPIFWAAFAFNIALLPYVTLRLFSFGWSKRIRVMAYSFISVIRNERLQESKLSVV